MSHRAVHVKVEFTTATYVPSTVDLPAAELYDAAGTPRYQLTTTVLRPTGELDLWEHVVTAVYRAIGSALESVGILAFEIVSLDMRLEPTEVTA